MDAIYLLLLLACVGLIFGLAQACARLAGPR